MRPSARVAVAFAGLALVAADLAQAQWVMLARRAVGRIEQMSQTAPNGTSGFDTATVIVEVPLDRVYDTVQRYVRANQGVTITREDPAGRRIEFTDGNRNAGIQAISLGDNLTQLLVSSAHSQGANSPTSQIVERIVAVCRQMNVECSRAS